MRVNVSAHRGEEERGMLQERSLTEVLGSATEGGSAIVLRGQALFRDAKVSHADVAVGRQKDVLRLQISVTTTVTTVGEVNARRRKRRTGR